MTNFNIRQSTAEEKLVVPAYRFSLLNEVATCPTLGALTYGFLPPDLPNQDESEDGPRNMAQSAGRVMHQVFAAVRLLELLPHDDLFDMHGERLFGKDRFEQMWQVFERRAPDGDRIQRMSFCLEALYSTGYYDDPDDKYRTLANLEQVAAAYVDRWDYSRKVYRHGDMVGIELPFDLIVEDDAGWKARFIGTLDALHENIDGSGKLVVHENKTGRYINDAWASTFLMSHQVTGYCIASSVMTGQQVRDALIIGSQIPLNTSMPIRFEPVSREAHHIEQWLAWFKWGVETYERAKADPIAAPKFTHSCGRYFSTCGMMPFCHGDRDEKVRIIETLKQGHQV